MGAKWVRLHPPKSTKSLIYLKIDLITLPDLPHPPKHRRNIIARELTPQQRLRRYAPPIELIPDYIEVQPVSVLVPTGLIDTRVKYNPVFGTSINPAKRDTRYLCFIKGKGYLCRDVRNQLINHMSQQGDTQYEME